MAIDIYSTSHSGCRTAEQSDLYIEIREVVKMWLKLLVNILKKDQRGLTFVEFLLVSALLLFLMAGTYNLLYFGQKNWKKISEENEAEQYARLAVSGLVRELREAQKPSDTLSVVEIANKNEIEFYADINSNLGPERIHYLIDNNQRLVRRILNPSNGEYPWEYSGSEGNEQIVARYVRNDNAQPIFRYYNNNTQELTSVPLSQTDRSGIRTVNIRLLIDVVLGQAPPQYEVESEVRLRNLRD
ncbi:MAG: hypothetical protein HY776_03975 [Actinobacteria bacterium]|nr:hypothetical protein [Actinomycetota bacterium]